MKLAELMQAHAEAARPVALDVTIDGDRIAITARAEAELDGGVSVQVVRYLSARTVDIRRGENAGRSLTYHNIVADWVVLDEWSGRGTYRGSVRVTGDDSVAVILQQAGHGPILAAARAR